MLRRSVLVVVFTVLSAVWSGAFGASLPEATPEEAGLSSERLERLSAMIEQAVDSGEIPGAVVMIARKGKLVYQRAFGVQDAAKGVPMTQDSIFRIFSMTKPIVSVSAMILVEEGKLGLHEPISRHLPEFKDMQIAVEGFDPVTGAQTFTTIPAKRSITVQDLLRHTAGLTYGVFLPKHSRVGELYREARVFSAPSLEAFSRTIAGLPLRNEPGTTWEYSHATDILGRVVEVAAGMPLDQFIEQRILRPLKMNDTGWYVPQEKVARFAQPFPEREKDWFPELLALDFTQPPTFLGGGHGLVSTAGDYLRFAQMLANGGELDGVRVLGPKTIAYMAADHVLSADIAKGPNWLPGPGYGFGLGFGTRIADGGPNWAGTVGDFYWGGYAGTYFWIDPKEELVPVFMMQEVTRRNHYRALVRNMVYQAIIQ
ncbi:MAG: beta-lactamase family protein [Burkholderiales bacterium]|nr:beta-lactamase family protein [Burkholderiales bacterium]